MEQAGNDERPITFPIHVPLEQQGGAYANFVSIWYTAYEFTLDFCATQPAMVEDEDDPEAPVVVPSTVVSRVRIPTTLAFDVLRALDDNLTRYERAYGEIKEPTDLVEEEEE